MIVDQRFARRRFLTQAALGAAGGLLVSGFKPASAIEPLNRSHGPKFKFSLAAYSYRELFKAGKDQPPVSTLEEFIVDCAKMNLDGVELTSYYFPKDLSDEYLHARRRQAFRLGLDISGTAVGNDFCHPPGQARDDAMSLVKKWVDHAAVLTAPVIRVFSGSQKPGQTLEEAERLAIEGLEEACEYAGKQGITLALENHGGLTLRPEGMLSLVKAVNSPWFGVNLDSGNFRGKDPYEDLAQIAPYAVNVQVKVSIHPEGGSRQRIDYSRLADILRTVNYRGYVVLEYEEAKLDPREECPKEIDLLREAFA